MKNKSSKKYWLVFVGIVLIVAIAVFCIWLPIRNKTKAPVAQNSNSSLSDINKNDNANGNQNLNVNLNNNVNTNKSVENTNQAPTPPPTTPPVNPDSSSLNSNQTTTDYSKVEDGNFDER